MQKFRHASDELKKKETEKKLKRKKREQKKEDTANIQCDDPLGLRFPFSVDVRIFFVFPGCPRTLHARYTVVEKGKKTKAGQVYFPFFQKVKKETKEKQTKNESSIRGQEWYHKNETHFYIKVGNVGARVKMHGRVLKISWT